MFNPEEVPLTDTYVKKKLQLLLRVPGITLGCLEETLTLEELTDRFKKACFLGTHKHISKHIQLYETEDLGLGYVDVLSIKAVKRMLDARLLNPSIPVHVRYMYGNLFFLIDESNLDRRVLQTRTVSLAYHEGLKQVYDIHLGPHVSPNRLYHLQQYDGVITTLEKVLKNDMVSCFHIHSFSTDLSDITH